MPTNEEKSRSASPRPQAEPSPAVSGTRLPTGRGASEFGTHGGPGPRKVPSPAADEADETDRG